MREYLGRCGPLGWVEGQEGCEKLRSGGGLKGEFGADDGAGGSCVAWKSEGFGVRETFEAGPGFFGRDSAEFEYLRGADLISRGWQIEACLWSERGGDLLW